MPAATVVYVNNPLGMIQFQRGPVIANDLLRRGQNVLIQAKLNATGQPVQGIPALGIPGPQNPGNRGPRIRTGRLHGSIRMIEGADFTSLYVDVGTDVDYGRYLEQGFLPGGRVRTTGSAERRTYPFISVALSAAAN